MRRFKFDGSLEAGAVLSRLLLDAVRHQPRPDLIVPVPPSRSRMRRRGLDHALELARPLSRRLSIQLAAGAAARVADSPPQSGISTVAARRRNVRGAFHVKHSRVRGRTVAVVDDVMTSCATVSELASALRAAGAVVVDAWVVARAVQGQDGLTRPGSRPRVRSSG